MRVGILRRRLVMVALIGLLAACARADRSDRSTNQGIRLQSVARGLKSPVYLTAPAGDPRLFIVEQAGRIRIVENGRLLAAPFLDIRDRVGAGGERGLLSVAFHPRYSSNGFFFVNFTDRRGDTHVERYSVTSHPGVADPSSGKLILFVQQPYANHNGGHILFGPDGMLYIGMGDGGSGGDPHGNGQNLGTLLGKMLRIDVDHGDPYAIPRDNPYPHRSGARPEVWASGLRNPWRFCFDPAESLLYIADVGQNRWEEIDVVRSTRAGINFGWNLMEGTHCYGSDDCDRAGLTLPILDYSHRDGCSVTGGFVYRGRKIPSLAGSYFYSDYCDGWIRSLRYSEGRPPALHGWNFGKRYPVSSFGVDASGEMYVVSHDGEVLEIVPDR